jgi:hypothetical protein
MNHKVNDSLLEDGNSVRKISELATVIAGFSPRVNERKRTGAYLLLGGRNIKNGKLIRTEKDSYTDEIDRESFRRAVARSGDILVSTLFDKRKLYVYSEYDPPAVVNNSCAIIRSEQRNEYIASYLRTIEGQLDFLEKASKETRGAFIKRLSVKDLADILIPILPFHDLARLGDANIQRAEQSDLYQLKLELESKDRLIGELKTRYEEMERRFHQDRILAVQSQIRTNDLCTKIMHGETANLEFKSTLRWNIYTKRKDPEIENEVLKTIAAFCNTREGELLIGVGNDGAILGTEMDGFKDNDKFLLHLRNLITVRLRPCIVEFVDYEMIQLDGKWICLIKCKPSNRDIWFKADNNTPSQFFVRSGPSSSLLDGPDAIHYIKNHFRE